MVKGSIGILPELKRGTVENGLQICRLTTAKSCKGDTKWRKYEIKENKVSVEWILL
jgi:hypothetical protein